jgi:D-alanyl-D-alanine carboxypeptidase
LIAELAGRPVLQHGGAISGYSAAAIRVPGERLFVAILSNTERASAHPFELARRLAEMAMRVTN